MSTSAGAFLTTLHSILIVLNVAGNSAVCAIIKRNRDMRIPINYLLVNLAVGDIFFATFIAPRVILRHRLSHPDGMTGTVLCKLLTGGNLAWIGGVSSVASMVIIAIERYYAVIHPVGDRGRLSFRKLKVIIPGCWIFSLIFNIPLFLILTFEKKTNDCVETWPQEWMGKAYSLAWLAVSVLSCALMVGLYSRVVYTLWFKRDDHNQVNHHLPQKMGVIRVRKRVTLMVATVSAIFAVCWNTECVEYVLRYFASYEINPVKVSIVNTLPLLNAAVNPFVYALLNQQFREKIKRVIWSSRFREPRIYVTDKTHDMELSETNTDNRKETLQGVES